MANDNGGSSYGWVVIAGGFLMHLALGTIYCW